MVRTVMNCFSCAHWSATYDKCLFGLMEHKYQDKDFCRRWEADQKYVIMKDKMQVQINVSRWNSVNITHRKLEVM